MIKSEKIDKEETKFPCLMKHEKRGHIVLMTSNEHGMVIHSDLHPIGFNTAKWDMDQFVLFDGKVILENE